MRLLKTHSYTSERRGNEVDKVRQNKIRKGGPDLKGQEYIVNESHDYATRNGGEGEEVS